MRYRSVTLLCSILVAAPGVALPAAADKASAVQVPAAKVPADKASGLESVKSRLDKLELAPLPGNQTVYIPPVAIVYAKGYRDASVHYREADYQLSESDRGKLQKVYTSVLQEWFKDRGWKVVAEKEAATLVLKLQFTDFWLAAPLKESPQVRKTLADEYARFTVSGDLARTADDQVILRFADRRQIDRSGATLAYNSVLFWKAVEFDAELLGITLLEDTAKARK